METNRYQNGSIYKLCCKDPAITDCYVGSTCAFRNRKWKHKYSCNNENSKGYNYNVYQFIRDHGGFSNWDMIELIKYPCNTKRELELKEREYLEMLGGTLNNQIPTRSIKEYGKAHYEANKEEINEKAKIYRQVNKEREKERCKAYREANKEEIKEKQSEKFNCEVCGGKFTHSNKSFHIKTPKHQKFLNEIKE